MTKVIKCDCGFVVQAKTDEELVKAARTHAKDVHEIDLSDEQILAMAEPV